MWYTHRNAQVNDKSDYLSFLSSEIPFLREMQERYPRKARYLEEIIQQIETKITNIQAAAMAESSNSPKTPNPRVTTMPTGFHDRLRRITFDLMNQNPSIANSLESYHDMVPLGLLSPLDRLYQSNGDDIRSHYDPVREMLQRKHGDSVKLYRAEDIKPTMSDKPLSAYTNARGIAEKFVYPGRHVVERQIPVESIWGASRFVSDTGERPTEFWIDNSKIIP